MKKGIHPQYNEITVRSACGSVFTIKSTLSKDINVEVCADSHPFYTGKQRVVDTGGRIDKFNKKFNIPGLKK